jgi:hypothetical protein
MSDCFEEYDVRQREENRRATEEIFGDLEVLETLVAEQARRSARLEPTLSRPEAREAVNRIGLSLRVGTAHSARSR